MFTINIIVYISILLLAIIIVDTTTLVAVVDINKS